MFFPGSPSNVIGKEIQFGISGTRSEIKIYRLYVYIFHTCHKLYIRLFDPINTTSLLFFLSLRSDRTQQISALLYTRINETKEFTKNDSATV